MNDALKMGAMFVVGGVIVLAIGLAGTFSLTQTIIGIILVLVGAITLKSAARR